MDLLAESLHGASRPRRATPRAAVAGVDRLVLSDGQILRLFETGLFISCAVREVLEAAITRELADDFFATLQPTARFFSTNPANTLPYRALRTLEDSGILLVADTLKDESKLRNIGALVARPELRDHRDVIGHPMTIEWRRPGLQNFVDSGKYATDIRPALVWDVQRQINGHLAGTTRRRFNETFEPTTGMVLMLHSILELSFNAEARAILPTAEILRERMARFTPPYLEFLEAHPDGK